ncbi:hypothetical protein EDB86DRAFT_3075674 [Lactarius hatsudake]|nr:hypothetical protein EDB86DRAFT_3075674 [Lactarius hatsudake]
MNKISKTRVRDSVEMTVFGFSHVGLFDVDDKYMLIISSVASAIGLFVDVWFIPTYSGADVRKFHSLPLSYYKVAYLHIRVGWRGSLGRAGAWYWTAIIGWSVAVVTWMCYSVLLTNTSMGEALTPSVPESVFVFTRKILPRILGVMLAISHPPLSRDYVLGNGGKSRSVGGCSALSCDPYAKPGSSLSITRNQKLVRRKPGAGIPRITVLSTLLVLLLVALLLPGKSRPRLPARSPRDLPDARPPAPLRHADSAPSVLAFALPFARSQTRSLLPPADATRPHTASVLAVWVRTLATAGL